MIISDASAKNNVVTLISHIYRGQEIITKSVHYIMNITFTKAEIFAIRCRINCIVLSYASSFVWKLHPYRVKHTSLPSMAATFLATHLMAVLSRMQEVDLIFFIFFFSFYFIFLYSFILFLEPGLGLE